jgi:hypothetical protein
MLTTFSGTVGGQLRQVLLYNEMNSYIAVFPDAENAFNKTPIFGLAYTAIKMHSSYFIY